MQAWSWQLAVCSTFQQDTFSVGDMTALFYHFIPSQLFKSDSNSLLVLWSLLLLIQGEGVLKRQDELIAEAVSKAEVLCLGGVTGRNHDWGQALGCIVTGDLIGWRSSLGNKLALASQERGLRPAGVVAYKEVRRSPCLVCFWPWRQMKYMLCKL
jgi:hypothetical protein